MLEEGRAGEGHSRAKRERRLRTGRHGERFPGYAWRPLAGALGGHPHEGRGRAALHGDVLDARRISPSLIYGIFAPLRAAELRDRAYGERQRLAGNQGSVDRGGGGGSVRLRGRARVHVERVLPAGPDRPRTQPPSRSRRTAFQRPPPGPVTGIKTVFSSGPSFLCGIVPLRHCGTPSLIRPHYTFLRGCLRRRIQHIRS